ncbi:hypothetical protein MRB53_029764 [Persea americana]|uniref:Uncharacterized protein n=1 Tax=Persea americana TaxID=3435 RepID=A0ACC2KJQ3_PERAE|nr:hypothetical protein MRB53_029764 [Persea americana]
MSAGYSKITESTQNLDESNGKANFQSNGKKKFDPVINELASIKLVATLIAVYAHISFAEISGIGWGWAGVIWIYSVIFYIPLDIIKFFVRYSLSGEAWKLLFDRKTAFTSKKDYGKEDREAQWVLSQRTLQGFNSFDYSPKGMRPLIAEQARRRAEIARLGELHTLRGHVESVVRLKNLDVNVIQAAHTV